MKPFVDRDEELAWLREGWDSGRPQFRILFGRRRVGKSALLDQFAHDKRAVIYQAVEGTTGDHMRDLTAAERGRNRDRRRTRIGPGPGR